MFKGLERLVLRVARRFRSARKNLTSRRLHIVWSGSEGLGGATGDRSPTGGRRLVALTFDDGPSAWTEQILDIFAEQRVRATFFVLGAAIPGREETVRRMRSEGHEIGNHLFSHRDAAELTADEIAAEITQTGRLIRGIVGYEPVLVRPPYCSAPEAVARAARRVGSLTTVLRSIDPADWRQSDPDQIVDGVLEKLHDGAIVCLHDGESPDGEGLASRDATVAAVAMLIPRLTAEGYRPVTVSEVLRGTARR